MKIPLLDQPLDISEEVKVVKRDIDSSDPASNLELEINRLKLSAHKLLIEQEQERLRRLKKNNERRPGLFILICGVVVFFYYLFVVCAAHGPNPVDLMIQPNKFEHSSAIFYYFTVLMILLAGIPTVLLIVLIRAIFSPQDKSDNGILDSMPMFAAAKNAIKSD